MNTPLRIEITDTAQAHIIVAAAWWAENRPAAPDAIRQDLDRILGLLCVQVADDALQVLALWHTSRGLGPSL